MTEKNFIPVPKRHGQSLGITKKRLFEYLLTGKSLTALDSVALFGCLCMGQRLGELRRNQGVPIQSNFEFTATGKRLKRYFLPVQYIKDYTSGKIPPIDFDGTATDTTAI